VMRLRILFDNVPGEPGLRSLWGFAVLVEQRKRSWLFDTGSNGRFLLYNAKKMGIDLSQIRELVITHPHWDHTGGIDSVLEVAPWARLYLPRSISPRWRRDLEELSGGVRVVGEEPVELFGGVFSTGVMAEIGEQSVLIPSKRGWVLLTGCAHAGILAIAERAREMTGEAPSLVMGGFHLMESSEDEIRRTIHGLRALGVEEVCPTHCTGERATAMFREAYGQKCLRGGVGRVLEIRGE